jgi:hypothetical protein
LGHVGSACTLLGEGWLRVEVGGPATDGSGAEWKYVNVFHITDGDATEVWGMAENDANVDRSSTRCPTDHT